MEEHQCKYKFWRWVLTKAIKNPKVYWLLWGLIAVLGVCAWRFGFAGVSWW